jgi:hypothetical protein
MTQSVNWIELICMPNSVPFDTSFHSQPCHRQMLVIDEANLPAVPNRSKFVKVKMNILHTFLERSLPIHFQPTRASGCVNR